MSSTLATMKTNATVATSKLDVQQNTNTTTNAPESGGSRFASLRNAAGPATKSAKGRRGEVIEVIPGRRVSNRKEIEKHFPNTTRVLSKFGGDSGIVAADAERHQKSESLRVSRARSERLAEENSRWKHRVEAHRRASKARTEERREELSGRSLSASSRRQALIDDRVNQLLSLDRLRAEKAQRAIRAGTNNHCPL